MKPVSGKPPFVKGTEEWFLDLEAFIRRLELKTIRPVYFTPLPRNSSLILTISLSFSMLILLWMDPVGTYTIMGDVSQNIHFGYGLGDWEALRRLILPNPMDSFGLLKKSYRNTVEISDFATAILRLSRSLSRMGICFDRRAAVRCAAPPSRQTTAMVSYPAADLPGRRAEKYRRPEKEPQAKKRKHQGQRRLGQPGL